MSKLISISLSPNVEKDDVLLAFKLLFSIWNRVKGKAILELEEEFKKYLGTKYAFSFNSGRSSLIAILNSLGLEKGSEVLLQAFTCNAVANPVIWSGLKPVYVDCNEKTFNIDVEDLKKKISPKSRAVIIQHTFGLPADIDEILEVCRQNNLILIEDCAHSLGAEYKEKKVGTFGKASFFSFSRDKVISSVYGGMVATDDEKLAEKIKEYQEKVGYPGYFWSCQQLLHPVLMNWFILPTYKSFGKYFFVLFQELNILSKAVTLKEKRGMRPWYFPKRMQNSLAILALNQLKKLERFNNHRREIANFYYNELKGAGFELPANPEDRKQNFLRFTLRNEKAYEIIKKFWDNNILIGDWYTTSIAPDYNKLEKIKYGKNLCPASENVGYVFGSCPVSEKLAKETFNLPTHINISKEDARKITDFLKQWK